MALTQCPASLPYNAQYCINRRLAVKYGSKNGGTPGTPVKCAMPRRSAVGIPGLQAGEDVK